MNRKRGVNNSENKLLYDPNQRKQRRLGAFSMEENVSDDEENSEEVEQEEEQNAQEQETQSQSEQVNDEQVQSASGGGAVKNAASTAKNVAGDAAKKAVKQAGKAIGKVIGALAKKLLAFIVANPWVLLILGIVLLIFIIIIILAGDTEGHGYGYYDTQCNFNESVVTLSTCNTEDSTPLTIDEYVLGATYALTKDNNYSEEVIKAIMIIIKTNALSNGGYTSSSKQLYLDDCDVAFEYSIPDEDKEMLNGYYNEIEEYLFLATTYNSTITTLGRRDIVQLNDNLINEMTSVDGDYASILETVYKIDDNNDNQTTNRENIFIGDSRTNGMRIAGLIDSNHTVYGTGYGYNWFVGEGNFNSSNTNALSGGIDGANQLMNANMDYNIIIWLGINDFGYISAQQYYDIYYELATGDWSNNMLYIVAVGPVDENISTINNTDVDTFNNELENLINNSGLSNLRYIDINYNIESYDSAGVHYSNTDYINIYNDILDGIQSRVDTEKSLYKMSDYCTYYTLTENDAYWWPIGSIAPTEGDIYGGVPSSTTITSVFGNRTINGINGNHGAIDIGATCNDNVVIAAKDGEVIATSNTCSNDGYYQNSCGGGFGNYVFIKHDDGVVTKYAHLYPDSIVVSVGDRVVQGQKIAMVGNSGSSTGCHLHFQVEVNGTKVDPLEYVDPDNPRPLNLSSGNINLAYIGNDEDSKNAICQTLLASGFSSNAVIGIMINLYAESGFSPINLQNSYEGSLGFTDSSYTVAVDNGTYSKDSFIHDSAGYGIIQWTYYTRKEGLYNYAKNNNYSIGSLEMQLQYMLIELEANTKTYKYITGNYSAADISNAWCDFFEGPSGSEPCRNNNICPSSTCSYRTNSNITAMTNYVMNGCQ